MNRPHLGLLPVFLPVSPVTYGWCSAQLVCSTSELGLLKLLAQLAYTGRAHLSARRRSLCAPRTLFAGV